MQKRSTFVCFVDAKKAFDRVQRDCLWYKLMSLEIDGNILKATQFLYHDLRCAVKINNLQTSFFDVNIGVKQGCKVSPTLFSLYVNDLADKIKSLNCGIDVDGYQLSILLYADDIALLSPCEESLQTMLNAVNEWCANWKVTLNQEKTKIVQFRPCRIEQCVFNFNCGDMNLAYAQSYKYLVFWFQENLYMKFATSELAKSASRALSALYTKYLHLGGMSYNTWKKLYESLVEPVLLYASGIWGMSDFGKIKMVQNKSWRYFLGLGKNAANIASQGGMGWSSCFVKQRIEVCRLYCKLKKTDDGRFFNKIFLWSSNNGKCWERRVKNYFSELGMWLLLENCNHSSTKYIVKRIRQKIIWKDEDKWKSELFNDRNNINGNKLRTYRIFKGKLETEHYVSAAMSRSHRSILAKFRSGSLSLLIETVRHAKVPLQNRICQLCNSNQIEDEMHFLLNCDFYGD